MLLSNKTIKKHSVQKMEDFAPNESNVNQDFFQIKPDLFKKLQTNEQFVESMYEIKVKHLIKNQAKNDLMIPFYQQELVEVDELNKVVLKRKLTVEEYQRIIKSLSGKPFMIFRHSNSSPIYRGYIDEKEFLEIQEEFQFKDNHFRSIIKDIESIAANYFNWNIIDVYTDDALLHGKKFILSLLEAICVQLEFSNSNLNDLKNKNWLLSHYEWLIDLKSYDDYDFVLASWKKYLSEFLNLISKYKQLDKTEVNTLFSLLPLAKKIANYRLKKMPYLYF